MLTIQTDSGQTKVENYCDDKGCLVSDAVAIMLKLCDLIAEEKGESIEKVLDWMFLITLSRTKDYLNLKQIEEDVERLNDI